MSTTTTADEQLAAALADHSTSAARAYFIAGWVASALDHEQPIDAEQFRTACAEAVRACPGQGVHASL